MILDLSSTHLACDNHKLLLGRKVGDKISATDAYTLMHNSPNPDRTWPTMTTSCRLAKKTMTMLERAVEKEVFCACIAGRMTAANTTTTVTAARFSAMRVRRHVLCEAQAAGLRA